MIGPDEVVPSRMISVSASVNLSLHHKVQKFSSGTTSPGWSQKKGRKMVVVWCVVYMYISQPFLRLEFLPLFIPGCAKVPEIMVSDLQTGCPVAN